ncbi:MAG: type II secretion system protein GspG [Candidatus Omnitrophica bacterium]|nr:type II secretion system protein GspG [Candidatus Omnitrophota bacterium]
MKKSFTLIELIVVIAIIAILAAIIAPNAFKAIEKARAAKTTADLKSIKTGTTALYADTGKVIRGCLAFTQTDPETYINASNAGLITKPDFEAAPVGGCQWTQGAVNAWDGPYIESNGLDFWKNAYLYDPDYAFCAPPGCGGVSPCENVYSDSACDNSSAREVCVANGGSTATPIAPPVLLSFGPDGHEYSCDDIVTTMTLN